MGKGHSTQRLGAKFGPQLGGWPNNTAYMAFIWNTDGFPLGSGVLSFIAGEVQQLR